MNFFFFPAVSVYCLGQWSQPSCPGKTPPYSQIQSSWRIREGPHGFSWHAHQGEGGPCCQGDVSLPCMTDFVLIDMWGIWNVSLCLLTFLNQNMNRLVITIHSTNTDDVQRVKAKGNTYTWMTASVNKLGMITSPHVLKRNPPFKVVWWIIIFCVPLCSSGTCATWTTCWLDWPSIPILSPSALSICSSSPSSPSTSRRGSGAVVASRSSRWTPWLRGSSTSMPTSTQPPLI